MCIYVIIMHIIIIYIYIYVAALFQVVKFTVRLFKCSPDSVYFDTYLSFLKATEQYLMEKI